MLLACFRHYFRTSVPDLTLDSHSRRGGLPFSRGEKVPACAEAQKGWGG
jgi:hypothetical protein